MAQESAKPHREALGELLPELFAAAPAPAAILRPQLQAAARSWLADIARSSTLLIGVDDFVDAQNVAPGQQVLLDASVRIELTSLTREDSENLLKSLFNDAPDIGTVAHRLYELACGNPRDLLQLAQHLVAQGSARYEGGCWTLGLGAHDAGLPSSLEQAVRDRVAAISGKALELASALALCPDLSFSLEECASLCQQGSDALMTELSELDDVARPFGGLGAGVGIADISELERDAGARASLPRGLLSPREPRAAAQVRAHDAGAARLVVRHGASAGITSSANSRSDFDDSSCVRSPHENAPT